MWLLQMTNAARDWINVGTFESVGAAVQRIIELDGSQAFGIFLTMHVLGGATDAEAFYHLHYDGRRALYSIKRRVN